MEKNPAKLIGQATAEEIAKWKEDIAAKYGKDAVVFGYKTEDGRIAYFRSMDRLTYSQATSKLSSSPGKMHETMINGCWLGGDETIRKVDSYWFGVIDNIEELMDKKKGSLVEL